MTTVGSTVTPHNSAMRPPGSIWTTVVFSWHLPRLWRRRLKLVRKAGYTWSRWQDEGQCPCLHPFSFNTSCHQEVMHTPPTTSITQTSVFGEIKFEQNIYPIQRTYLWWKFSLMMNTCYTVPQHHRLQINTSLALDCSLPLVDLCTCLQCLHSDIGGHQCFIKNFLLGRGELSQDSTPKHVEQTVCEECLL